jgi:hypothetical protein
MVPKGWPRPSYELDFAGQKIVDPSIANWTVNQGPMISGSSDDVIISYQFYAWMFVPTSSVSII